MKRQIRVLLTLFAVALLSRGIADAQVASNSPYTLNQSVIASGSGTSADTGNSFSITGAIGQSITDTSGTSPFTVKSGFFTAAPLAPTAATVTVSGRVLTADGRGVRNVLIMMTDSSATIRIATSKTFGYFIFTDVQAGDTYIFTARGKRVSFSQPTQMLFVMEDFTELNFIALPQPKLTF